MIARSAQLSSSRRGQGRRFRCGQNGSSHGRERLRKQRCGRICWKALIFIVALSPGVAGAAEPSPGEAPAAMQQSAAVIAAPMSAATTRPVDGVPAIPPALALPNPLPTTAPAALSPATAPATAPSSPLDKTEIRRSGAASNAPGQPAPAAPAPTMELPRVALALGAVIGLIFFLRWGSRKFLALPAAASSSGVMQVVARSTLAPRQQLLLVRIGQRLLVVGDSGGRLSPLGQITDADEVATLVGQVKASSASGGPAAATFGSLVRKLGDRFRGVDRQSAEEAAAWDADLAASSEPNTRAERGQLLGGLDASEPATATESAVESARNDINVLREKLQQVTRRINGGTEDSNGPGGADSSGGFGRPSGELG